MTSKTLAILAALAALVAVATAAPAKADDYAYEGRKKCSGCHKSQYKSWTKTAHARALHSLEPGEKVEAKKKAGLDPEKDYTEDEKCLPCHVTGWGKRGGYEIDYPIKYLRGVTCEACHGPGTRYRVVHRKAAEKFEKQGEHTPRQELADVGQEFHFVERCKSCHMNYEGSPWKGAKAPYTPFTPKVDPKYAFDFDKYLRDDHAMHAHFKLSGAFVGEPLTDFHKDFQAKAEPIVPDE
jgi:hypothetical protein